MSIPVSHPSSPLPFAGSGMVTAGFFGGCEVEVYTDCVVVLSATIDLYAGDDAASDDDYFAAMTFAEDHGAQTGGGPSHKDRVAGLLIEVFPVDSPHSLVMTYTKK